MNDSRQLLIPDARVDVARPLDARFRDAVLDAWGRVLEPGAANTRRAYEGHWQRWCAFAEQLGIAPLPIDETRLIGYLTILSERCAPNTVRQALSALSSVDQLARITPINPNPQSLRSSAAVKRWLKSWSRDNPRAPRRRAAVVRPAQLAHLLDVAREPASRASRVGHVQRYARDRALILLGVTTGCRVSELVALDVVDVERTDRGLTVRVRRSKTDQEGQGRSVAVLPQGRPLLCPVDAWTQWLNVRGDWDGPAFVAVLRTGVLEHERLTKRSVQRMIGERAKRAGLSLVSSHSMRRSMATVATEKGKSMLSVKRQGGWQSLDSLSLYVEEATLYRGNPSAGLLDESEHDG